MPRDGRGIFRACSRQVIIWDSMIDLFCMGETFDVYIAMVGIIPEETTQSNYLMLFDWISQHLDEWDKNDVHVNSVGISVYSDMLEKFIKRFGFEYRALNPAKGKVFETTVEKLKSNPLVKKGIRNFANRLWFGGEVCLMESVGYF